MPENTNKRRRPALSPVHTARHDPRRFFARDTHPELPLDPDAVQPGTYKWPPHFTPASLFTVFVGGCFGAAARYWVGLQLPQPENGWPRGTLFVNLLGAFLLGLLLEGLARLGDDQDSRRSARLAVGTGFMGAFTTYSTFAVESDTLLQHGRTTLAGVYIVVTVTGGVILSTLGIWVAAAHHKRRAARQ